MGHLHAAFLPIRAETFLPEMGVPCVAHGTPQSKGRRPQRGPCRMRWRNSVLYSMPLIDLQDVPRRRALQWV